jgi:hypothetical protein
MDPSRCEQKVIAKEQDDQSEDRIGIIAAKDKKNRAHASRNDSRGEINRKSPLLA